MRPRFVLVVEKEAVFARLNEERFASTYRCVLITGKGFPDLATRTFVGRLSMAMRRAVPVYGLFDFNPSGASICMQYKIGSKPFATEPEGCCCPDLKWLGVLDAQVSRAFREHDESLPLLSARQTQIANGLLQRDAFVRQHPQWAYQLRRMIERERKCEIEGLYPPTPSPSFSRVVYGWICEGKAI